MSISQVSWERLLKVTPMHSYTHRGHTQRTLTLTQTQTHRDPHAHRGTDARGPTGKPTLILSGFVCLLCPSTVPD